MAPSGTSLWVFGLTQDKLSSVAIPLSLCSFLHHLLGQLRPFHLTQCWLPHFRLLTATSAGVCPSSGGLARVLNPMSDKVPQIDAFLLIQSYILASLMKPLKIQSQRVSPGSCPHVLTDAPNTFGILSFSSLIRNSLCTAKLC